MALRQLSAAAELLQLETSEAFPRGGGPASEAPEYQRRCQRAEGELQELRLGKCWGFFEFSCCFFFWLFFVNFFVVNKKQNEIGKVGWIQIFFLRRLVGWSFFLFDIFFFARKK